MAITPSLSVALDPGQQVLRLNDGERTGVNVYATSNLTGAPTGKLNLELLSGWRTEPASSDVRLPNRGDKQNFSFNVFPAKRTEERAEIHAVLDAGGKKYSEGYTLVTREDLGSFYYFEPAVQHVSIVDAKIPENLKVGYIMGAGDDIPQALEQIGSKKGHMALERLRRDVVERGFTARSEFGGVSGQ